MNEENQPLLAAPSSPTAYPSYTNAGDMLAVRGVRRSKRVTRWSFVLVLLTETLERTAFYGLICNMLLFLNTNPMGWMSYNASIVILVLNGLSYVTAIGGGWLADSCLGKFRTIVIFFCIYIAGYTVWPVLYPYPNVHALDTVTNLSAPSWCSVTTQNDTGTDLRPTSKENCWWPVYISVVVIAIGYGAVRVNLIPFGADQVWYNFSHYVKMIKNSVHLNCACLAAG
jgi:dipeptide/tripeptide permease